MFAGIATIGVVSLCLTPEEQGFWYTFGSLVALQLLFELGMSQVVVVLVSHEAARVDEQSEAVLRLGQLMRIVNVWSSLAAIAFLVIVGPLGSMFLETQASLPRNEWMVPWWCLVLTTAINLTLNTKLSFYEGIGKINGVAWLRFAQSALGSAIVWAILYAGMGLWAICALPAITATCSAVWLISQPKLASRSGDTSQPKPVVWLRDIFPYQWRIGVSWASGWLIFQAFTPLTFAYQGSEQAGKLGMSFAIFAGIQTISMAWIQAKTPAMASKLAKGESSEAKKIYIKMAQHGLFLVIAACSASILALRVLQSTFPEVALRFLDGTALYCIAVNTITNYCIAAAATFMRLHKHEPMMWQSVLGGITIFGVAFVSVQSSISMMLICVALINVTLFLPLTLFTLLKYKCFDTPRHR